MSIQTYFDNIQVPTYIRYPVTCNRAEYSEEVCSYEPEPRKLDNTCYSPDTWRYNSYKLNRRKTPINNFTQILFEMQNTETSYTNVGTL